MCLRGEVEVDFLIHDCIHNILHLLCHTVSQCKICVFVCGNYQLVNLW